MTTASSQEDAETSSSPSTSFGIYQPLLQKTALTAAKQAYLLPIDTDMAFHRTLDKKFAVDVDAVSARVFALTNKLLKFAHGVNVSIGSGKGKAVVREEEDLLEGYHTSVVDVMDQLYETADKYLDEYTGRSKSTSIPTHAPVARTANGNSSTHQYPKHSGRLPASLMHAANIPKPQDRFMAPVNNENHKIWRPILKTKFNALVPLDYVPIPDQDAMDSSNQEDITVLYGKHPYAYEITHLTYPLHILQPPSAPISPSPPPFAPTPFQFVSTPAALRALGRKLSSPNTREVAIDLEHHSYRTYAGFVCLIQISTREEDWVVDCLEPSVRNALGDVLGPIFSDPKVVKVLHGAESDIVWLQQDFGLYIVNLFDTYHASVLLGGFPKNGLASLLEHFCGFTADKRYQLADWRIRPLPEEMLFYARSDTHFLLYVYDRLRLLLLERDRLSSASSSTDTRDTLDTPSSASLASVLSASAQTALRLYDPVVYDYENGKGADGWDILMRKYGRTRTGVPGAVFVAIHQWRDRVARELDESVKYILPQHHIFKLSDYPPKDLASLFSTVSPVPPVVRDRGPELLEVMKRAVWEHTQGSDVATGQINEGNSMTPMDVSLDAGTANVPIPAASLILPDLWSLTSSGGEQPPIAVNSALLGNLIPSHQSMVHTSPLDLKYTATSSSLFGPGFGNTMSGMTGNAIPSEMDALNARYRAIVAKIHSTLVTAPSIPSIAPPEPTLDPDALVMPAEIPFVPSAQRTTLNSSTAPSASVVASTSGPMESNEPDSIVVVGRKTKKKNKLKRKMSEPDINTQVADSGVGDNATDGDITVPSTIQAMPGPAPAKKSSGSAKAKRADEVSVEPFDYSSVPNLLDAQDDIRAEPEAAGSSDRRSKKLKTGKEKKDKGKKPPVLEYGNFPAPPRSRAEPRSGNMSRSFK